MRAAPDQNAKRVGLSARAGCLPRRRGSATLQDGARPGDKVQRASSRWPNSGKAPGQPSRRNDTHRAALKAATRRPGIERATEPRGAAHIERALDVS